MMETIKTETVAMMSVELKKVSTAQEDQLLKSILATKFVEMAMTLRSSIVMMVMIRIMMVVLQAVKLRKAMIAMEEMRILQIPAMIYVEMESSWVKVTATMVFLVLWMDVHLIAQ